jgi:oligosaccharide translocation protein RFT1
MSDARAHVGAAARGVRAHVLWQLSSRLASFGLKAAAVRALGPKHFAFAEVRLALLTASSRPAALGVRKIALRSSEDPAAAALVLLGNMVTVALAALLAAMLAYWDREHAGPIVVAALAAAVVGLSERGFVFATRRERYELIFKARALARILGSVATTVSVVVLPARWLSLYTAPAGLLVHALTLWWAVERAAGVGIPKMSIASLPNSLCLEDVRMAAIAAWQAVFRFLLENGEGIVLDITCGDDIKGAYRLAGNIGSLLARFFSEALEEQSFNIFARLAPSFRKPDANANDLKKMEGVPSAPSGAEGKAMGEKALKEMRDECVQVMQMSLKAALLISLLIACIGPFFSYTFLRVLYGGAWADDTPAVLLLNSYFAYLVFMAANGVSEAFVSASASTKGLRNESVFSLLLSGLYMAALYWFGRRYAATGIIAVNCLNMTARTVYALAYFTRFTGQSVRVLTAALPHPAVFLALFIGNTVCRISERIVFATPFDGMEQLLVRAVTHAASGVFALTAFCAAVYVFEGNFRRYIATLRHGRIALVDDITSLQVRRTSERVHAD